jgi:hypothetical protein
MNKRQGQGEEIYLTPSIVHMPLCMCECLCNLFSTPIESFNIFNTLVFYYGMGMVEYKFEENTRDDP